MHNYYLARKLYELNILSMLARHQLGKGLADELIEQIIMYCVGLCGIAWGYDTSIHMTNIKEIALQARHPERVMACVNWYIGAYQDRLNALKESELPPPMLQN